MSAEWSVIYECFFTPSKYDFLVRVGVGVREDSNFTFKCVVRIGTKKALAYAVRNLTVTRRNTMLKERLAGEIPVKGEKKPAAVYPFETERKEGENE